VVGPACDATTGDGDCFWGAQAWGVVRCQDIATATGGGYLDLTESGADCTPASWPGLARALGEWIRREPISPS
jgi:hypothetical protein